MFAFYPYINSNYYNCWNIIVRTAVFYCFHKVCSMGCTLCVTSAMYFVFCVFFKIVKIKKYRIYF